MENILENNRLIAEFLGLKKDNPNTNWFYNAESGKYFKENELEYHQKWGWIMPVVEKIEKLGFETSLDKNGFFVRYNGSNTQSGLFNKNKIESVYSACVEFIKWYNNQN